MERFWKHVKKTESCWEWQACKTDKGYGRFQFQSKAVRAHRFAWEIVNGKISDGLLILHRCDNPACVNPDHLRLGTQKENIDDCRSKGRRDDRGEKNYFYNNPMRGEMNGRARLTIEQAAYILSRKGLEKQSDLAQQFGVSKGTISAIQTGKNWKGLLPGNSM